MRHIAILGGGVAGLAAAHRVQELARERGVAVDVALYERAENAGGCVRTLHEDGFTMELGPDSLLIDKPAIARLIERLQLSGEIVEMLPEFKGACVVHRGTLRRIPPDFRLFTPRSIPALLASGIFSPAGVARAAMEPLVRRREDVGDESVASFVTRRLGREVLDRLAQPLIGGIYSGDPQRLSMRAVLPQLLDIEQRYGSLIRGMRNASEAGAPVRLVSLRRGLGSLVDALCARLGTAVRANADVTALSYSEESWKIALANGEMHDASAVVSALPAYATAALIRAHDARLSGFLERIRYNSIATINLIYDSGAGKALPRSSGFVVPFVEHRSITAATFTTQKYPQRAAGNTLLMRAFSGGALQPQLVELQDLELQDLAHRDLAALAGVSEPPRSSVVQRWHRALPEYGVGHVELVASIAERAAALPGFALAGSAYRGVGIPDCVASGEEAAESVFQWICRSPSSSVDDC